MSKYPSHEIVPSHYNCPTGCVVDSDGKFLPVGIVNDPIGQAGMRLAVEIEDACMADANGHSCSGIVTCPRCNGNVGYSLTIDHMLIFNCHGCGIGAMAEWLGECDGATGATGPDQ